MKLFSRIFGLLLVLVGLSSALYYFAFFDISVSWGYQAVALPT
jgi:hypothetical protein